MNLNLMYANTWTWINTWKMSLYNMICKNRCAAGNLTLLCDIFITVTMALLPGSRYYCYPLHRCNMMVSWHLRSTFIFLSLMLGNQHWRSHSPIQPQRSCCLENLVSVSRYLPQLRLLHCIWIEQTSELHLIDFFKSRTLSDVSPCLSMSIQH